MKEERKTKKNGGITLIALVVTIILLLILSSVTINIVINEGILDNASKAKIMQELAEYKEELGMYILEKQMDNIDFKAESLTVGKTNLEYNTRKEGEEGNIRTVIPNISDKYFESMEIIKGKLLINTKNEKEIKIAQSLEIEVNPYDIVDGVLLSSKGNLLLMDNTGTVTIPDSVTKIGAGAFANLEGLKKIIIPGSVKEIEDNAFSYNTTLETAIMQEGVEKIGNQAFMECRNIQQVKLPESIVKIGTLCFYDCFKLEQINIPSKLEQISQYMLSGCISLTSIVLPEKLTEIQSYAFRETSITELKIPSSVTSIGNNVFSDCTKLDKIDLTGNENYVYESGMLMSKEKDNILFISDKYLREITTFTIPDKVITFGTNIATYANIKKIIIPSSLSKIADNVLPTSIEEIEVKTGNETFVSENGILYKKETGELVVCYSKETDITIQEGITQLGNYSFKQAINAKRIELPETLQKIGSQVFSSCINVEEIKIGANVSSIQPLFKHGNYNGTVTIDKDNSNYMIENNILYGKDESNGKNKSRLVTVLYKIQGTFTINSDVEEIGSLAFHAQRNMTEVIIPEGVRTISDSFNYCSGLQKIEIPSTVKSISANCFVNSQNLDEIFIKQKEGAIEGAPWGATKTDKVVVWQK